MDMSFFTSPLYLVILGVGVIAVILMVRVIMKLRKRPNKKAKSDLTYDLTTPTGIFFEKVEVEQVEKITKEGVINARIYNTEHRSRSLRHVELIPGEDYGRQWLYGPNLVFALQENKDGTLTVIRPPKSMEHPPSELYEALQTKDDVAEVLGNRSEDSDKIKLGLLVMAACVALFIMFMAIYNKGGG